MILRDIFMQCPEEKTLHIHHDNRVTRGRYYEDHMLGYLAGHTLDRCELVRETPTMMEVHMYGGGSCDG